MLKALIAFLTLWFVYAANALQLTSIEPSTIPGDARDAISVLLLGNNIPSPQQHNLTCHFRGGQFTADYGPNVKLHGPPGTADAQWLNSTAVKCTVPNTGILDVDSMADLKLDGNESFSNNSHPVLSIRTFVDVAFSRRPYLSNETEHIEILLRAHADAMARFPATRGMKYINVCRSIGTGTTRYQHHCSKIEIQQGGQAIAVPLQLGDVSWVTDEVVAIDLTATCEDDSGNCRAGDFFRFATKQRRLMVATVDGLPSVDSFVAVDHRRKLITRNGIPILTNGFYFGGITAYLRGNVSLQTAIDEITELAAQGLNHVQPYGMEDLNDDDLDVFLKHFEQHGMLFGWGMVGVTAKMINSTLGFNSSAEAWRNFTSAMDKVRRSPSLLGYYICDDCDAGPPAYPLDGLAKIYTAIKERDPYHIILGAPWNSPWGISTWSEAGGMLALDMPQVENYIEQPAYHLERNADAFNRIGMAFEPMINSPPMYLLTGPDVGQNKAPIKGPWPACLEASLSWMGLIAYGAAAQLNFIYEPKQVWPTADIAGHVASLGSYARTARTLMNAILPDVTKKGTALQVEQLAGSTCVIPAGSGRKAVSNASVSYKGFIDLTIEAFCAHVVVVNLCPRVTSFTLHAELPEWISHAEHEFEAVYNVSLQGGAWSDSLPGYASAVYRFGCHIPSAVLFV